MNGAEVARLEAARVYTTVCREFHTRGTRVDPLEFRATALLQRLASCGPPVENLGTTRPKPGRKRRIPAPERVSQLVEDAVVAGCRNSQIIAALGVSYETVRAARDRLRGAA